MSAVLFVESLSYPTLIISLLFRLIGIDVVCFNINTNLFVSKENLLHKFGIKLVSFSELPKINPSVIDGDSQDKITKCVDDLFKGDQFFDFFHELFPGIDELNRKLRIFARQYASHGFWDQMSMIHWLENSEYRDSLIFSIVSYQGNVKYLWKDSSLNVFNLVLPGYWIVKRFVSIAKSFVRRILSNILVRDTCDRTLNDVGSVNSKLEKSAKVVYFPHNSIFSSAFVKDHFYADDPVSPFHAANIQHIEYDKRSNIADDSKKTCEYVSCNTIQYESLPDVSYKDLFSSIVSFVIFLVRNIHKIIVLDGSSLRSIIGVGVLYMSYRKYLLAISSLNQTKIALVGYDILFPKGLSLALETRNIRTVATQERFSMPFFNDFSYILDTQFTVSSYVDRVIESKSSHFFVKYCIPVGQTRSDYFFKQDKKKTIGDSICRLVVFDFHVDPDPLLQKRSPVINWDNDRSFRQDILRLAELYPDAEFVFRGKNDDWLYNSYFKDIVERVNCSQNIQVDSDFDTWGRSYYLASNADLIIAKPTSIAEECISNGYEVLIADYGINYSKHVSGYYPHSDRGNYCHSFAELKDKVKRFMSRGYVIEPEDMKFMTEEIFGGLTDGNVRNRVQQRLHSILEQS